MAALDVVWGMGCDQTAAVVSCLNGFVELDGRIAILTANNRSQRVRLPYDELIALMVGCARQRAGEHGWKRMRATIDGREVSVTMSDVQADPRYRRWAEIQVIIPDGFCTVFLDDFAISQITAADL